MQVLISALYLVQFANIQCCLCLYNCIETKAALRLSKPRSEWTEEEKGTVAKSASSAKLHRKGSALEQLVSDLQSNIHEAPV